MNRELKCEATNCVYNRFERCGALAIKVMGENPADSEETFCSTFHRRDNDEVISQLPNSYFKSAVTQLDNEDDLSPYLSCLVKDCQYNHRRVCIADEVVVQGSNSLYPEATCCATFQPRF